LKLEFAAFALIPGKKGDILWKLRRDLDLWDLPGGCCEESDFLAGRSYDRSCLFREVAEETGLTIQVLGLVGIYFTEAVKNHIPSISATYWCEVVSGELRENDEAAKFGWFGPDDLPDNAFRLHREMVNDLPLWSAVLSKQGKLIGGDLRGLVDIHRRALL